MNHVHDVLPGIVSGRWNYLHLHFPVFPQGILVICALLLFLSGVRFLVRFAVYFMLVGKIALREFILFLIFFLPVIASPYRAVLS